jgi:hypothetical protein
MKQEIPKSEARELECADSITAIEQLPTIDAITVSNVPNWVTRKNVYKAIPTRPHARVVANCADSRLFPVTK